MPNDVPTKLSSFRRLTLLTPLVRIFHFKGRSARSEVFVLVFWLLLTNIIFGFIFDPIFSDHFDFLLEESPEEALSFFYQSLIFSIVVYGGFCVCGISLAVRRLHDCGRSGWWLPLGIIMPGINVFFLLWLCWAPGNVGQNRYGADPLRFVRIDKLKKVEPDNEATFKNDGLWDDN